MTERADIDAEWGVQATARTSIFERIINAWRSSLQAKVLASVLAMTLISLAIVTALMSTTIRDGIVNQRRQSVLTESARSITNVQTLVNSSAASNSTQVQQLLQDTIAMLQSGAGGQRDVFLWRMRNKPTPLITVNDVSSDPELGGLITTDLRISVSRDVESAHWQAIGIPDGDAIHPGIVVGAAIEVPVAGTFELYLMYSLDAEQRTLTFIQRVLVVSIAALTGILVLITWLATRQIVRPIVAVSTSAERIADGHLDERLPVRGSDEVAALETSFNAMAASLQEQIERLAHLSSLQRRFVSDVSHELRTPLTTVRMAVDMLHDDRDAFPTATRRSVELLKGQIDRFELLLTDLLEISRFDAGAAQLDVDARDVTVMVRGIIDGMMPLADNAQVAIELKAPIDRVVCEFDTIRFERIIRNLLANAIEHAEGKPVEVEIAQTTSAVAVRVRDHGVGLSKSDLSHVFDRFWRGDPARARTTGGTGLGLSIALEDALLHGGRLEVAGAPGKGATFMLTLPKNASTPILEAPLTVRDPLPRPLRYNTLISLEDVEVPRGDMPKAGSES